MEEMLSVVFEYVLQARGLKRHGFTGHFYTKNHIEQLEIRAIRCPILTAWQYLHQYPMYTYIYKYMCIHM